MTCFRCWCSFQDVITWKLNNLTMCSIYYVNGISQRILETLIRAFLFQFKINIQRRKIGKKNERVLKKAIWWHWKTALQDFQKNYKNESWAALCQKDLHWMMCQIWRQVSWWRQPLNIGMRLYSRLWDLLLRRPLKALFKNIKQNGSTPLFPKPSYIADGEIWNTYSISLSKDEARTKLSTSVERDRQNG